MSLKLIKMTTNQLLICLAIVILLYCVYHFMNNRKKNHLGKDKKKGQTNDWEKKSGKYKILEDFFQGMLDKDKKVDENLRAEVREWIKEHKSKND